MHSPPEAPQRSTFVTVIAIIFIALSALSVLSATMNYFVMQSSPLFAEPQPGSELWESMPESFRMLMANQGWIVLYGIATNGLWLAASIGLLLRKNWGRLTFIGLLLLNLVMMLAMAIVLPFLMQTMMVGTEEIPSEARDIFMIITIMIALCVVAFWGALSGWIIWKLTRPTIRAEFVA